MLRSVIQVSRPYGKDTRSGSPPGSKMRPCERRSPKYAEGPPLTPEEMALTCGYVVRSEGLEPPAF
jgi:hypothetical protein